MGEMGIWKTPTVLASAQVPLPESQPLPEPLLSPGTSPSRRWALFWQAECWWLSRLARVEEGGQGRAHSLWRLMLGPGQKCEDISLLFADRGCACVCERPEQAEGSAFAVCGPPEGGCGVLPGAPNPARAVSRTWGLGGLA